MAEEIDSGGGYSAGSVYLGVGLDLERIDKDVLDIPAKVARIPDIKISVRADVDGFRQQMQQLEQEAAKKNCIKIPVCADEEHFRQSIEKLRNIKIDCIPVEICIDEKKFEQDLLKLNRQVELEASIDLSVIQQQLDAISAKQRTIIYDAYVNQPDLTPLNRKINYSTDNAKGLGDFILPELKKTFKEAFKDASKDLKKDNVFGAVGDVVGGVVSAPFRVAGAVGSPFITGALRGIGESLTADFGKGLAQSLSGKLGGSFGSTQFLGERVGDGLAALGIKAKDATVEQIKKANKFIDNSLNAEAISVDKYSISLSPFRREIREIKRIKKEFQEAIDLGIEDYAIALDEAFPESSRIAEAAAQRAKVQSRRKGVKNLAQPQIVAENQQELQQLAQLQANINDFLSANKSITAGQRKELQDEIEQIKARRSEVIGQFKSISTPELQRQGAESAISRTQKQIKTVDARLEGKQVELAGIEPSAENIREYETIQAQVLSLSKQKQSLENTLQRQKSALEKIPQQANQAIEEVFDTILGAAVPLEKLPLIIVDETRAIQSNAKAFYSAFENVIVVNKEIGAQIDEGKLVGQQLKDALEEASHVLQFDYGSAKGLEALSTKRSPITQPIRQVSVPTPEETIGLAQELQNYDPRVRIVELEAKVNAARKAALIEERRSAESLAKDLENAAGFGGIKLGTIADKRLETYKSQIAEIQSIADTAGIDIVNTVEEISTSIANLEDSVISTLKGVAASSTAKLPLNEIEQIKGQMLQNIDSLAAVGALVQSATSELKTKIDQKKVVSILDERAIAIPAKADLASNPQTVGGAIQSVASELIVPAARHGGDALLAVGKAGYKVVEGFESLVLDIIPAGRTLKATAQFVAKNVAFPAGVAIAASQIPKVGGLETVAVETAGHLVQSLVGLSGTAIASHVQTIVSAAIPSFIPNSTGIVHTIASHITELVTNVLDVTGTATAEGLATVLSGSTILNVLKKGVSAAGGAASDIGQRIVETPQAQNVLNAPLPFSPQQNEKVLEFADQAGRATGHLVNAAGQILEPIAQKTNEAIEQIQSIDKAKAMHIAEEYGAKTRNFIDKGIEVVEDAIAAIELTTAKLPGGQKLADLSREQLERLKRQLETKFEFASTAEAEGRPVVGGSDSIRGDIGRVQRVIEAKTEVVPERPAILERPVIARLDYENNLKKIIKDESRQVEQLRSRLLENLRTGSLSNATAVANELKASSQAAIGKLEAFKSNQAFDLEPAIRKSVNGYITRFKDLIAQAENATAKIENGEDFGTLLSIDTKLLAERFTGLVNKLFEVEGKNLQEALGKAALSPRGKDIAVAATGFAGAQVGSHLGILPQVGAELTGAIASRQVVNVADTAVQARTELLGDEAYKSANALEKLAQITALTIEKLKAFESQKGLGHALTSDIAGVGLGNASTALGNLAAPGLGSVAGITAALGGAPKIAAIRQAINERLASVPSEPQTEEFGILRSARPSQPAYSQKDIEALRNIERQLAEIERLSRQIEKSGQRYDAIKKSVGETEAKNRRANRFDAVEYDQAQRASALQLEQLKEQQRLQEDLSQKRRNRFTQSDITTVLSDIAPQPPKAADDRLLQIKQERDVQKEVIADRLEGIRQAGALERKQQAEQLRAQQETLTDRLAALKQEAEANKALSLPSARPDSLAIAAEEGRKARERESNSLESRLIQARLNSPASQINRKIEIAASEQKPLIPPVETPKSSIERPEDVTARLAALKAEAEAKQNAFTTNLEQIAQERKARENAVNERLAKVKAEAETEKAIARDVLAARLEAQKLEGIRDRRTFASQVPKEDLTQYLTRVPGTTRGSGRRGSTPPTLFIPETEDEFNIFGQKTSVSGSIFNGAKKAASGFLGILEKIPSPIKNIFFLLGGGFVGVQAFQFIQQQAGEAYEAVKKLQSQKISLEISTGNLPQALDFTAAQADKLGLGLNSVRDGYSGIAAALRGGSLASEGQSITAGLLTSVSALQLSDENSSRVFTQFKQIASKPKLQTEDLITLSESLPGAPKIAERALGLKEGELPQLLQTGQISSTQALPKIAEQFEKEFGAAAVSAGKSAQAIENRFTSTALVLQQNLGERALPAITTGLKFATSALSFLAENSDKLSVLLNVALLGGLTLVTKSVIGLSVQFAGLVGAEIAAAGGLRIFAQESLKVGGALAGRLALAAGQFLLMAAASKIAIDAMGLFGDKAESVTEAIDKITKSQQDLAKAFKDTPKELVQSKGQYSSFDELFKDTGKDIGAAQRLKEARKEDETYGGLDFALGGFAGGAIRRGITKGDFFFDTKQRQIVTQKVEKAEQVEDLVGKGISQVQSKISKAGGINLLPTSEFKAAKDAITDQDNALKELIKNADSIKERNIYENVRKQLEPLIRSFETGKEITLDLAKAFKELSEVNLKTERDLAEASSKAATDRGAGRISDYQAQTQAIKDQNAALKEGLPKAEAYVNKLKKEFSTDDYKKRAENLQVNEAEDQAKLLAAEKEVFSKRQQLGENFTKDREIEYNRRAELLQREITAEETFRTKLEGLSRVRTSRAQLGITRQQADRTISPFQVQLAQAGITANDAASKEAIANQKLIDQRKDAQKALTNLKQVNPNDEQAYQAAKTQYEGIRNAALQTQAEINDARKQGFEAAIATNQAIEEDTRTQIELTVKAFEQGITSQEQATQRIVDAEKRRSEANIAGLQRQQKEIDLYISGLDRASRLSGKRGELAGAQNQLAQLPFEAADSKVKGIESLIEKIKGLDKTTVNPETQARQDAEKAERLRGVLRQTLLKREGGSDFRLGEKDEDRAFQLRVTAENKIADLKAAALTQEIDQSKITLSIEEQKEAAIARRAIIEAKITKEQAEQSAIAAQTERKKAELGLIRSQGAVIKASGQLDLAQASGDPNKIREAQLNLKDAQLGTEIAKESLLGAQQTEKISKDALPLAASSVVDALSNFAATLEGNKLQRKILGVQNQNKVGQFNLTEDQRRFGIQIEGAEKNVNTRRLFPERLRADRGQLSPLLQDNLPPANLRVGSGDRANSIYTIPTYGLGLRRGETLGGLEQFNGRGSIVPNTQPFLPPPSYQTQDFSALRSPSFDTKAIDTTPLTNSNDVIVELLDKIAGLEQLVADKLTVISSRTPVQNVTVEAADKDQVEDILSFRGM